MLKAPLKTSQLVLQPCSNRVAQANLRRTILSPVLATDILTYATDMELKHRKYFTRGENQQVALWGVKEKQGRPKQMWERMRKGDLVLFYADKSFVLIGTIDYTFTSPALADHLWPEVGTPPDLSYKFLYVVKNPLPLYTSTVNGLRGGIPSESLLNGAVIEGLGSNGVVMGITVVSDTGTQKFIEQSPTIKDYYESMKRGKGINLSDPAFNAQLDLLTETGALDARDVYRMAKFRTEQGQLRDLMLGGRSSLPCSICGEEYPAPAITTAHIKKRSECTSREKGDPNVVTPMCYLGCDFLFENGYIVVDSQGKVRANLSKVTTTALSHQVARLEGRSCLNLTQKNAVYYASHREFHGA